MKDPFVSDTYVCDKSNIKSLYIEKINDVYVIVASLYDSYINRVIYEGENKEVCKSALFKYAQQLTSKNDL